jgi:hypothetical protein
MKRKPIKDMSAQEAKEWIQDLRERLQRKQAREKSYLTHRAKRGTRTPTDEAYELDQILEDELLELLDNVEQGLVG